MDAKDKIERLFTDRRNTLINLAHYLSKYREELQKDENTRRKELKESSNENQE